VGPNITPDPVAGLGAWTFDDFVRAMRKGRDPSGRPYYPAFPYPSFTGITDEDLRDLWAWLQALPADPRANEPHELRSIYGVRGLLRFWKITGFQAGPWEPDPLDPLDPGAYLAEAVGHCGECHTPRGPLGGLRASRHLSGSNEPPEGGPNLTPHEDGLGDWSARDIDSFLRDGETPEGDVVGGAMRQLIMDGTRRLSKEERKALVDWLRAQDPLPAHRAGGG